MITRKEYDTVMRSECQAELSSFSSNQADDIWANETSNVWDSFERCDNGVFIVQCTEGSSGYERRQIIEKVDGCEVLNIIYNKKDRTSFYVYGRKESLEDLQGNDGIKVQPLLPMMKIRAGLVEMAKKICSEPNNKVKLSVECVKDMPASTLHDDLLVNLSSFSGGEHNHVLDQAFPASGRGIIATKNDLSLLLTRRNFSVECSSQSRVFFCWTDSRFPIEYLLCLVATLSSLKCVLSIEIQSPIQFFNHL